MNTNHKASAEAPFRLYAKDFDENGSIDPVLSHYVDGVEQAVAYRDKLIEQIPPMKRRFTTYKQYAETPFKELFTATELKNAQRFESTIFESCYIENLGKGAFALRPLPPALQMAPLKKFHVADMDGDGHLDALVIGNDYSTEVTLGRYDAFTGALMLGNGKGNFTIERGHPSGFKTDKNAQNMIALPLGKAPAAEEVIWVGNNSDSLQVFQKLEQK